MNDMTIRIAIGCHSYLLGEGIKKLFREEDGIDVIGIFDEGIDMKEILKLTPDIILADFKIFRSFPDEFPDDNPTKILLISDRSWLSESERQIPELLEFTHNIKSSFESHILNKAGKFVIYVSSFN